jgi:hypothetical protein
MTCAELAKIISVFLSSDFWWAHLAIVLIMCALSAMVTWICFTLRYATGIEYQQAREFRLRNKGAVQ